jgi:histidinol phosphatase-like enzyme
LIREFLPVSVALICPHLSSKNCNCRKPKTGLIEKFRDLFPGSHQKELYIGDQISDQTCAAKLGLPFIMVDNSFSKHNNINAALENH